MISSQKSQKTNLDDRKLQMDSKLNSNPRIQLFKSISIEVLLLCGFFSSLFYIGTDLIASWWYEGYNILDQNYSELLATGAPTRTFMILVSITYTILMVSFAVGVWTTAYPKRSAHYAAIAIVLYAIIGLAGGSIFQMDLRGAERTPLGRLHPHATMIMSFFIILSIVIGS